jgi:hypothetical protein
VFFGGAYFSLSATFAFFQRSLVVDQPVNARKDPNVADREKYREELVIFDDRCRIFGLSNPASNAISDFVAIPIPMTMTASSFTKETRRSTTIKLRIPAKPKNRRHGSLRGSVAAGHPRTFKHSKSLWLSIFCSHSKRPRTKMAHGPHEEKSRTKQASSLDEKKSQMRNRSPQILKAIKGERNFLKQNIRRCDASKAIIP